MINIPNKLVNSAGTKFGFSVNLCFHILRIFLPLFFTIIVFLNLYVNLRKILLS
jgi:hypothetical protein